jgi:hypothetical protein
MVLIQHKVAGITKSYSTRAIWPAFAVLSTIIGACSCTFVHAASNEATAQIYTASLDQTAAAITNAFRSSVYHNMLFMSAPLAFDTARKRWSGRPATNEWELWSALVPLASVTKGKKIVPYFAHFDIRLDPTGTNQCKATVTTISAHIQDGKEIGIHGGWAWRAKNAPPIPQEEKNVLLRIESQLDRMRNGDPTPLPPTADTNDAADYPMKQLMELSPDAKTNILPLKNGVKPLP